MLDETDLRRDAQRAERAKALLGDELLMGAFDQLRALYVEELLASPASDAVRREKLYLAARIVPAVKANLEKLMMDGSIAAKQLANLEDDARRRK